MAIQRSLYTLVLLLVATSCLNRQQLVSVHATDTAAAALDLTGLLHSLDTESFIGSSYTADVNSKKSKKKRKETTPLDIEDIAGAWKDLMKNVAEKTKEAEKKAADKARNHQKQRSKKRQTSTTLRDARERLRDVAERAAGNSQQRQRSKQKQRIPRSRELPRRSEDPRPQPRELNSHQDRSINNNRRKRTKKRGSKRDLSGLINSFFEPAGVGKAAAAARGGERVHVPGHQDKKQNQAIDYSELLDTFLNTVREESAESDQQQPLDLKGLLETFFQLPDSASLDGSSTGAGLESMMQSILQGMQVGDNYAISKLFKNIGLFPTNETESHAGTDMFPTKDDFVEQVMELLTAAPPDHHAHNATTGLHHQGVARKILELIRDLLGSEVIRSFHPLQFYYYMMDQEHRKNAVRKRHNHRDYPTIDTKETIDLADNLYLSQLAYASDCSTITNHIRTFQKGLWLLRNCSTTAQPYQPAHFVLVPYGDIALAPAQAVIVVRGSSEMADFVSSTTWHSVDYENNLGASGQAHKGILQSAQWLHDLYRDDLLVVFDDVTEQDPLHLTLVGHSLGAGTAALAALEFASRHAQVRAHAVGFGTPAILSVALSQAVEDLVTTVVLDADIVPRLSAHTVTNAWYDALHYNFTRACLHDVEQLAPIAEDKLVAWRGDGMKHMIHSMREWLEFHIRRTAEQHLEMVRGANHSRGSDRHPNHQQGQDVMVPPGKCMHLHRDGTHWQMVNIPCYKFDQLEVVPHMLGDHMIGSGYYPGLLDYLRHSHKDLDWQFPHDMAPLLQ